MKKYSFSNKNIKFVLKMQFSIDGISTCQLVLPKAYFRSPTSYCISLWIILAHCVWLWKQNLL